MPPVTKHLLHIASFDGNIGDNASHNGLYRSLKQNMGWELEVRQQEIRKTYLNYSGSDRWCWDQGFIDSVNQQDVTFVGGGNYFELWLDQSATGTTIDLNPALLAGLQRPLCFHGIGCDPHNGVSDNTVARFREFMEAVHAHPLCFVAVRNDGSHKYLQQYLGQALADKTFVVPDPGFFVDAEAAAIPHSLQGRRYWVMNLAMDMAGRRFPGKDGWLDYEGFVQESAEFILWATGRWPDLEIVLAPHIYSDLKPILDVIDRLPDPIRRWRLSVAPYLHGMGAEKTLFALYRDAELAIGTRFHANVCPIGLGTPTIGLVTTEKLRDLYEELEMPERALIANQPGLVRRLAPLVEETLGSLQDVTGRYQQVRRGLEQQATKFYHHLSGSKAV